MKKALFTFIAIMLLGSVVFGQKIITKTAMVKFYSHTPVEDIEAFNNQTLSVLNTENGQVAFSLLMKSFEFEKALMQEHFNEKYVESTTYPKATFKGAIKNLDEINFKKDGTYDATVSGTMSMHGETREVITKGSVRVEGDNIMVTAEFKIAPGDYSIKIPSVVAEKIAKEIKVLVEATYTP